MSATIPCPEFDLTGKVAVVTGAGRGMGRYMALDLARYGADIVLCSRTKAELEEVGAEIEAMGRKALVVPADVCRIPEIERMTAAAVDRFGKIDILLNNAGMNIPQWAEEVTEEAWDRVMAVNVKGVFFCAQAVGRVMIRQKRGKIINVSSQAGSVGLIKRAAYGSSKGAVNNLTRVLALEWGKHNICVNALAPTFVETPMTRPDAEREILPRLRDGQHPSGQALQTRRPDRSPDLPGLRRLEHGHGPHPAHRRRLDRPLAGC